MDPHRVVSLEPELDWIWNRLRDRPWVGFEGISKKGELRWSLLWGGRGLPAAVRYELV